MSTSEAEVAAGLPSVSREVTGRESAAPCRSWMSGGCDCCACGAHWSWSGPCGSCALAVVTERRRMLANLVVSTNAKTSG